MPAAILFHIVTMSLTVFLNDFRANWQFGIIVGKTNNFYDLCKYYSVVP